MKNMTPAFVVILALTGAASAAYRGTIENHNGTQIAVSKASSFPVPTCPPDDPHGCGMGTIVSAR